MAPRPPKTRAARAVNEMAHLTAREAETFELDDRSRPCRWGPGQRWAKTEHGVLSYADYPTDSANRFRGLKMGPKRVSSVCVGRIMVSEKMTTHTVLDY